MAVTGCIQGVSAKSFEPKHGHAEGDHGEVVGRSFFVASGDATVLLEPADQPLDLVALAVGGRVEVGLARLVLAGWDDRFDPPLPEAATCRRTGIARSPAVRRGRRRGRPRPLRGTAPLSIRASKVNCSWRSPAVSTAVIGLPPPSARRCSLVEKPPWLRPSAAPTSSTVASPPDGAGPA